MNNTISEKNKEKVIRREVVKEDNALHEYTLTEKESTHVASFHLPLYSIKVEMVLGGEKTEAQLSDCFANKMKAEKFFDKLVRNLATPYDLIYVFEDSVTV